MVAPSENSSPLNSRYKLLPSSLTAINSSLFNSSSNVIQGVRLASIGVRTRSEESTDHTHDSFNEGSAEIVVGSSCAFALSPAPLLGNAFIDPLLLTVGEPPFLPFECCSRSCRLDCSCTESRSLVDRARVGEVGVVAVRGVDGDVGDDR